MAKSEASARSILALRYMQDFRCIGGDCEDSCCESGWAIYVDQEHLIKLRRALPQQVDAAASGSPDALPTFDQAVRMLPKAERSERAFAQLIPDEKGRCSLLSPQGLCRLHAQKGEDALPDTCAMYPRHLNQVGARLELAGALSCPEVARRALLPEDATDLVPVPLALQGRGQRQLEAPKGPVGGNAADPQAPYRHLDAVRGTMVRLLSLRDYPMSSRLFFTCFLAHKCSDLQSQPASPIDPLSFLERAAPMNSAEVQGELHQRLLDALPTAPLPLPLLMTVLRRQRQVPGGDAFARLVVELAASYRDDSADGTNTALTATSPSIDDPALADGARLDVAYRARQRIVDDVFRARIDHYLFNYARHFWMKDWYTLSPSLWLHTQSFLLRVAILRFVLLGHPQALAAARLGPTAGQDLLDRLAVRAFYSLSRAMEHSGGFRSAVQEYVQQQAAGIPDAIALLSV